MNVRASWLLVRAFARHLPPDGGSVVALTSDDTVGNVPYGATKAALDRIVLAAAHEYGTRGLRANVINPGPIDTGWMTPDLRDRLTAMQPSGRLGTHQVTSTELNPLFYSNACTMIGQWTRHFPRFVSARPSSGTCRLQSRRCPRHRTIASVSTGSDTSRN